MSPKVFKCIQKSPNEPNKSGPRVGKGGSMGSSLHPSYTQHTSGMIHATFRPERRRREGLYLPDVRRPTIPFCIFFVFLVFLKSLVLCDISCFAGAVLPPSQMALFLKKEFSCFTFYNYRWRKKTHFRNLFKIHGQRVHVCNSFRWKLAPAVLFSSYSLYIILLWKQNCENTFWQLLCLIPTFKKYYNWILQNT